MSKKKKQEEDKGPDQGWLMTYGDLMTLLVTFFVLMMTFSSIQLDDFKKAMGSLQGALGVLEIDRGEKIMATDFMAYSSLQELKENIEDLFEEEGYKESMQIEMTEHAAIRIILENSIIFDPGSARVKSSILPTLEKIGRILKDHSKLNALIEGHTDNIPIHTPQFESNWELSASRALSVVKFFIDNLSIHPNRLAAVGHGEYKPLVRNNTSKNRAKNRRVEIYISYENLNQSWND